MGNKQRKQVRALPPVNTKKPRDPKKFTEVDMTTEDTSDIPVDSVGSDKVVNDSARYRHFKTLDAFLEEEGIKDEVTAVAEGRISEYITQLIGELEAHSVSMSDTHRRVAEIKSLRQDDNPEQLTDLYSFPKPEETIEGRAVRTLKFLFDKAGFKVPEPIVEQPAVVTEGGEEETS